MNNYLNNKTNMVSKTFESFERKSKIVLERPNICLEIIDFLLGDFIGSGVSREVYEYALDDKWVIKIEKDDADGDNWAEWRVWGTVANTTDGTKDWFAECHWISSNGRVMMQRKTTDIDSKYDKIPKRIPAYFTDVKADNWGWIGNKFVCHDYSNCIERFGYFAITKKTQKFTYNN